MEFNIIPKFLDNALTPVAKEAGETLGDLINLARSPLIKARKVRDLKIEVFLNDLEKELKTIPEEKIVEPPLSIVGPALEELFKYYMEEEHIVEAFQKLISDSMNIEKQNRVLPSYFGIIKQMTKFDAVVFKKLVESKNYDAFTGFISVKETKTGEISKYHVTFWDDFCNGEQWHLDFSQNCINSLYTLKLLGLVNTKKIYYKDKKLEHIKDKDAEGYLDNRFKKILCNYKNESDFDFRLSKERIIVYILSVYGKNLGELLIG